MANKKINYLSRDFASIKDELIKFSNQYYPELADDFTDSSVGAWFIDLVSAVGDDLSYHTDRMYQETNLNSANLRSTLLNLARTNGIKIPGAKCSICEVELSCELPMQGGNDAGSIAQPNWDYAPIVQRTSLFSAGNQNFELTEDVNFAEQFNSDGYSNRKIVAARDSNGNITGYTVSKSTIAINGTTKVYKKVLTAADIKPFMEVVLPEANITNVESIIFKETSDITRSPEIYEYYIDAEEYRLSNSAVMTYRYFEVESLADQYRFGMVSTNQTDSNRVIADIYNPHVYEDYTETAADGTIKTTRYYRGAWKSLTQKFITEYTDNGYLKIIFGGSNGYGVLPENATTYGDYIASNIINNDMLGVLPKEGWSMYVLYRVGGGVSSNLGPGAINTISNAHVDWGGNTNNTDGAKRGRVLGSLSINNISTALAGKDTPSNEEIKYLVKYNTSAQNRAVTVKDYKVKLMQMPPKFGAPFRNTVIEANNKIEMSFLGLDASGKLDSALPQTLVNNVMEYMSNYRQINDYIEIKSGRIYNIGAEADVFIDKNYNAADVIANVINKINDYFAVDKHDMGEDIFVGDLEKEISLVDGVISLISLKIFKIWNGGYSPDKCPLPTKEPSGVCDTGSPTSYVVPGEYEEIDLDQVDHVLYGDYNSMYEIKNPTTDIQCRVKIR
jgi:hypothetical protein